VAVLAAFALACAAIALAGPKKGTVTVPEHTHQTATATCPKGQGALFAGFDTTLANLGPYVHPQAVVLSGRTLKVGAVNEQGSGSGFPAGQATAIAYCGSRAYPAKASAFVFVPAGQRKTVVATCPSGYSVALGGFRAAIAPAGTGARVYVDGLERVSKRKWRVSALNDGSAAGKLESLAYCTAGSQSLTPVTKSIHIQPGKVGTVTATCPKAKSLALGGLRSQHYAPGYGDLQLRAMKRKGSRGWQVSSLKYEPLLGELTAIAYCR
jgi:hypothetical protein